MLVIQLVLMVAAALKKPPRQENAKPRSLGEFQFPTASEERCVPILWGTCDLKGPNVIDAGDLRTEKLYTKVSGGMFRGSKKVTVGFRYFVGMDLLLCYGPVDRITRLEISNKVAFSGSVDMAASGDSGTALVINQPDLLGGKEKGGGVVGTFRLYKGSPSQQRNSYMVSAMGGGDPDNIPGYVDIAHAVFEQGEIGESADLGNYVFRVSRFPNNLSLGSNRHIVAGTADNGDANPAEVLYEILTAAHWGLELDPSYFNVSDFQDVGITCYDEGLGISQLVTSQTSALELIQGVLGLIDGVLYETTDGKFRLKLIRADYDVEDLDVFDETNVLTIESFSRMSWKETDNHFSAGYTDRNKDFISTTAPAQDLANVRTQGQESRLDQQFVGLATATAAAAVAQRELRQRSFPFAKVTLITNRDGQALRPGDVFLWSNAQLGISQMVLRVLAVEPGSMSQQKVKLTCVQDIFGLAEEIYAAPQPTGWSPVDNSAAAFSLELVRACPRLFLNLSFYENGEGDPSLGERIFSMAARPKGAVNTFEQWADPAGGSSYLEGQGFAFSVTPTGQLIGTYTHATADVETSSLLLIDGLIDVTQLSSATTTQISQGINLALIAGAAVDLDEIIGFESITDLGSGQYRLNNVHRGLMDTQARDHAADARIWFFTDGCAVSDTVFTDTQSINVKHQPETTDDELPIASATARPLVFATRLKRPHHPANFVCNTTRVPLLTSKTADLAFTWSHRLQTEPTIRDANIGSASGQHSEVEYDLEFLHAFTGSSLRTTTQDTADGAGWLAYTYTAANLQSDTGQVGHFPLEVRMRARYAAGSTVNPAGLTSLQQIRKTFSVDMGGSVLRSIDLNGTDEYLANTTNNTLGVANNWKLEAWVRGASSAAAGTADKIFIAKNSGNNNDRIELELLNDTNGAKFRIRLWNSTGTLFKDYEFGSYTVNTFTMLTIKWNGTTLEVRQDNVDQTSGATKTVDSAGTMGTATRRVILGVDDALTANFWNGLIQRVSLWDSIGTSNDVTTTFAGKSAFNVRFNSGNYTGSASLKQLWDWRNTSNIGASYGNGTGLIDVDTNAANIDGTDLSTTVAT